MNRLTQISYSGGEVVNYTYDDTGTFVAQYFGAGKLKKIAGNLKIKDCVKFIGYRNDIENVFPAFDVYLKAIDGRPNTKGGYYRVNLLPTTSHIYFGRVTGATPDG